MNAEEVLGQAGDMPVCGGEGDYRRLWLERVAAFTDPASMAFAGGACADRFAWVFVAGYQAAIRATFPDAPAADWLAFAVSEDRSGALPGVVRRGDVLAGHKTWVAAVDHIAGLVIKVGRGPGAEYAHLVRGTPGLALTNPSPASFLADLSQGRAALNDVAAEAVTWLNAGAVAGFGQREAICIYLAFCGHVANNAELPDQRRQAMDLAESAPDISNGTIHAAALQRFDRGVQGLFRAVASVVVPRAVDWETDSRVVTMYSAGLQSR